MGHEGMQLKIHNDHKHSFVFDVLLTVHLSIIISVIYLSAPELFFFILAHPVYKMWITQEPNMLELWNKLHFEENKTESIYHI